jgi:hypothetical protein
MASSATSENERGLQAQLETFVSALKLPGRLLFAKVWGSHSHDTAVSDSDVDYMVVFATDLALLLSLDPPPDTFTGEKPDFQAHEAAKFADLLRKGNLMVVEALFTERMIISSPEWEDLRAIRAQFLNAQTVNQYLGYCRGQLSRLQSGTRLHTAGGSYNTKWAYHLLRLARDAQRVSRGEAPVVWKDGAEREFLMRVRAGALTQADVEQAFSEIEAEISGRQQWPIPEKADTRALNRWLLSVRGLA